MSKFLQGEHIKPLVKVGVSAESILLESDRLTTEPSYWTMSQALKSLISRERIERGHSEFEEHTTDITQLDADPHTLLD